MPIYEYKCTECEHRLEKLQKMSDDPLKDCPECGTSSLTKLVSAASFKLKGTGWYETDFKNKKKPDNEPTKQPTSTTNKEPEQGTSNKATSNKATSNKTASNESSGKGSTSESKSQTTVAAKN